MTTRDHIAELHPSRATKGDVPAPRTQIEHTEDARFRRPALPTYSAAASALSIASLLAMATLSALMFVRLLDPAIGPAWLPAPAAPEGVGAWAWLPFLLAAAGATVGALFELGLLLAGTPFQQMRAPLSPIQRARLANLAPVTMSSFYLVVCLFVRDPATRLVLLHVSFAAGAGLGIALLAGAAERALPLALMGVHAAKIAIVIGSREPAGGALVAGLVIAQAAAQIAGLRTGSATPQRSAVFHALGTLSSALAYGAVVRTLAVDPGFSREVALGTVPGWSLVAAGLAGVILASKALPETRARLRASASQAVWSLWYFLLVSKVRFAKPVSLHRLYRHGRRPAPLKLMPYFRRHPTHLRQPLSIPASDRFEANVLAIPQVHSFEKAFALVAELDHLFPQADVEVPLKVKPRLPVWSDAADAWPALFAREIFGRTSPVQALEPAPRTAVAAYQEGQLLAYLAESGDASALLQPAEGRGRGALMLDLRFLEVYETKPDYEPYGGVAYFAIDRERARLRLVSVVPPRSREEIAVAPNDATFRRAERMIVASLYFHIISGKHLVEIHMAFNLVEVAMHNAFEAEGQWDHPFRAFMYLHLFSHQLAEELTTGHLVQEGAVFSQVFATTHDALVRHLDDRFHDLRYGADEDFEARAAMMTFQPAPGGGCGDDEARLLPHAAVAWELRYAAIWQRYTRALIDAIYQDDEAVRADRYLQGFHAELVALIPNGLPARYAGFQTREGVARYASDTIHHLVVRHQLYGTTGAKVSMDPRLVMTQVPRDGGTDALDERRALICVAVATAHARFTMMMDDYTYLLDGVPDAQRAPMRAAFETLQEDLRALEAAWNTTAEERAFNYEHLRAVPSELRTGPGY